MILVFDSKMNIYNIPTFKELLTHREFHQLTNWVDLFMLKHDLYPLTGYGVISLSGGADSLLLTLVLKHLQMRKKLKTLKFVHFHHGTRSSQDEELAFVQKFTTKIGIDGDFIYLKLRQKNNDQVISNFEMLAREKRYQVLEDELKVGDALYMGHHLDDSFEWSLMQQFKSSELRSTLGIPVKNGAIKRPFMCMARHQIEYLLKQFNMSYAIDPTNYDAKYERNYLRNNIIPKIKKQYPSYLKNYVARQNKLVEDKVPSVTERWNYIKDFLGGILLFHHSIGAKLNSDQVVDCIKELSSLNRGKIRDQLSKLIIAEQNNKKGPLSFSGGVKVYIDKKRLYFINREIASKIESIDNLILKQLSSSQIPDDGLELKQYPLERHNLLFPNIVYCRDKSAHQKLGPSLKKCSILLPQSTQYLIDHSIWFQSSDKISKINAKLTIERLTPRVKQQK
ncbi:MAG: tRNA lysidine(34) synthetase TilS [Bacteriovoracaceae bacterium]|jgi:tRNA(Ile)-lysidine synthase|nr:tRNA lysidine(34) synthetase TilS [Bacteriovoracaceae bacterium]